MIAPAVGQTRPSSKDGTLYQSNPFYRKIKNFYWFKDEINLNFIIQINLLHYLHMQDADDFNPQSHAPV